MNRLAGKIILISGGARGQGAAEARLFVAEGAKVVVGDVLLAEGERLAAELGDAAVFVPQDVTKEDDWAKAIDACAPLGGLHGLVNNAGISCRRKAVTSPAPRSRLTAARRCSHRL